MFRKQQKRKKKKSLGDSKRRGWMKKKSVEPASVPKSIIAVLEEHVFFANWMTSSFREEE